MPQPGRRTLWRVHRVCRSDLEHPRPSDADLVYPARLVSAHRLDALTGLLGVGGDALRESEALYDPDWD